MTAEMHGLRAFHASRFMACGRFILVLFKDD